MNQTEFLEQHVFTGLENLNEGADKETAFHFSETDFEIVLQRAEHFGIAIYSIAPWHDGKLYDTASHEDARKKATDPRWYKKAFKTFKARQDGLLYSATYKVSKKLLAR